MTPEEWEAYVKRFESCPKDCDTCGMKVDCCRRFDKAAGGCKFFRTESREPRWKMSQGNPMVENYTVALPHGLKIKPLAIEHVKGLALVGDGKWRAKK